MNIHIFDANILTNVLFLGIKKVSLWISWVKNFGSMYLAQSTPKFRLMPVSFS
jgi:hypothetical protein